MVKQAAFYLLVEESGRLTEVADGILVLCGCAKVRFVFGVCSLDLESDFV